MTRILKTVMFGAAFAAASASAHAAQITNSDADQVMLLVTENGERSELVVAGGETVSACDAGCFLSTPSGDRLVLTGSETVVISGGVARIQ